MSDETIDELEKRLADPKHQCEESSDPKLPKLEDTEKNLVKTKIEDPLQMLAPLFEMLGGMSEKSEKVFNEEMQI